MTVHLDRRSDDCERCGYHTSIWRTQRDSPFLCQICHKVPEDPVPAMCYVGNLILDELAKAKKEMDAIARKIKHVGGPG